MLTNTTGHQNWVDATFVFANCAAFSSKLMAKLTETSWQIATRKDDLGCVFVCVSQPLNPTAVVGGEGEAGEEGEAGRRVGGGEARVVVVGVCFYLLYLR